MRFPRVLSLLSMLALGIGTKSAVGASMPWAADGALASISPGAYYDLYAVPDGAGGVLLGWEYLAPGANKYVAMIQRLNGAGQVAPGWASNGTRVCPIDSAQSYMRIAPDKHGGLFVVWIDKRLPDTSQVYLQHFGATGQVAAGWPSAGVSVFSGGEDPPEFPHVEPDDAGGCYVTWHHSRAGNLSRMRVQRFTAAAVPAEGWPEGGVLATSSVTDQEIPGIIGRFTQPDGAGGVYLSWREYVSSKPMVFVQRIGPNHLPGMGWPENGIQISNPALLQNGAGIAALESDGLGGVFVLWARDSLCVTRIQRNGTQPSGWPVNGVAVGVSGGAASLRADGFGGAYVAFSGPSGSFRVSHVTSAAQIASGWAEGGTVLGTVNGVIGATGIVLGPGGSAIFSWGNLGAGPTTTLAKSPTGGAVAGWPVGGFTLSALGTDGAPYGVVPDDAMGTIVAWTDSRFPGQGAVYAARVSVVGDVQVGVDPTATAAALGLDVHTPCFVQDGMTLRFALVAGSDARLQLFDVQGRVQYMRDLRSSGSEATSGQVTVHPSGPGIYFARLSQGPLSRTVKVAVLR
ncbi:MAG: T9SS type A sorting domain-containing protein [Candidatus Eisenbacteria bacterium]